MPVDCHNKLGVVGAVRGQNPNEQAVFTGSSAALSAYLEEEDRADVGPKGRGRTGRHRSLVVVTEKRGTSYSLRRTQRIVAVREREQTSFSDATRLRVYA